MSEEMEEQSYSVLEIEGGFGILKALK